jgi:hypothetical protein
MRHNWFKELWDYAQTPEGQADFALTENAWDKAKRKVAIEEGKNFPSGLTSFDRLFLHQCKISSE